MTIVKDFKLFPFKDISQAEPSRLDKQESVGMEGIRILVAEDNQMVRDILSLALRRRGWRTEIAVDGREAVSKWRENQFELVLMDLQMPEMTGIEATQTIRELEAGRSKRARIIGITAHARGDIEKECLAAGMDRVLTKPVKLADLEKIIGDCFPGRCRKTQILQRQAIGHSPTDRL